MASSYTLSEEQVNFFHENGYLLVPNVLSKEEVTWLRTRMLNILGSGDWKKSPYNTEKVIATVFDTFPEFIEPILNEKAIEAVRSVLKNTPVLMPETAIHYKVYTGWHKDTTCIEKAGESFHQQEEAMILECGYYLQDNNELGGGLTVMPGSHKHSDYFVDWTAPKLSFFGRLKRKLGLYNEEKDTRVNPNAHTIVDIPSKAGDLVLFNMKTNHRATIPKNGNLLTVPDEKSKLAIFNAFASDNAAAHSYYKYISSRTEPFYQSLAHRTPNAELNAVAEKLRFKVK